MKNINLKKVLIRMMVKFFLIKLKFKNLTRKFI